MPSVTPNPHAVRAAQETVELLARQSGTQHATILRHPLFLNRLARIVQGAIDATLLERATRRSPSDR